MKRAEIYDRARAAAIVASKLSMPITYGLGRGGEDPTRHVPWDSRGRCDCSGFAAWAAKEPRANPGIPGGWIETTLVVKDAMSTRQMFRELVAGEQPEPGDFIVYGDRGGQQGHIGVISSAVDGKVYRVIHCSTGNDRGGPAIAETDARVFVAANAIVVRLRKSAS